MNLLPRGVVYLAFVICACLLMMIDLIDPVCSLFVWCIRYVGFMYLIQFHYIVFRMRKRDVNEILLIMLVLIVDTTLVLWAYQISLKDDTPLITGKI